MDYSTIDGVSVDDVAEVSEFDFNRCNFDLLNSRLRTVNWNTTAVAVTVDQAVAEFYNKFLGILRDTVPIRSRHPRRPTKKPPWWNPELRTLRNQLRNARKRYQNRSSWGNKVTLEHLESEFARLQDVNFRDYIAGVQDNLKRNPKSY